MSSIQIGTKGTTATSYSSVSHLVEPLRLMTTLLKVNGVRVFMRLLPVSDPRARDRRSSSTIRTQLTAFRMMYVGTTLRFSTKVYQPVSNTEPQSSLRHNGSMKTTCPGTYWSVAAISIYACPTNTKQVASVSPLLATPIPARTKVSFFGRPSVRPPQQKKRSSRLEPSLMRVSFNRHRYPKK